MPVDYRLSFIAERVEANWVIVKMQAWRACGTRLATLPLAARWGQMSPPIKQ